VHVVLFHNNEGGAAVALSLAGRTVVFVSCHLEAHHSKVEQRRQQYRALVTQLGSSLAEEGFHLNEQFHHIIWVGDMNYRLCTRKDKDGSYQQMSSDQVQQMLEYSQHRTLFDNHDQFNMEKRRREIFYGYREAEPFPNFYPTYKKIENRPPVDFK
jgi:endonuclease/exonuclease/phosphatase family metal-dependent hydrolase